MPADRSTLAEFLVEERRRHPGSCGDLNALVLDVALACTAISRRAASGALGWAGAVDARGEPQGLDVVAHEIVLRATEGGGQLAGLSSVELEEHYPVPAPRPRGSYLLTFDPLEGSSAIDVNAAVGSIFSILRAPTPGEPAVQEDFLRPGTEQVAAGYAIYGPSTVLVLTVGTGVHMFTLDPDLGEFILTRKAVQVPEATAEYAVTSARRFWEPPVLRYVDECLRGVDGPRDKDFSLRGAGSLVAETHRILTRGGVFLDPRDTRDAVTHGRRRLLHQANPVALLVEQAGGLASTGRERVLQVAPGGLHQRIPLIFGSREEVERIETYHREAADRADEAVRDAPFYGPRGLFRPAP